MIIYFTGTDNSKYIAEKIAGRLDDEVFASNEYIKKNERASFISEKPYVFVFPVYLSTSPTIFRNFIKSCSFSGNRDAYFIPTCASTDGSVPNSSKDLCDATGLLEYKGCQKICMPQNYILFFKPAGDEKKKELYKEAELAINSICDVIKQHGTLNEKPASRFEYLCTKLVEKWYNHDFTFTRFFCAGDDCIGCGICADKCPTNSIEIVNGKPVWIKRHCIHCMSCISRCPKQTIEFGKLTKGKARHLYKY